MHYFRFFFNILEIAGDNIMKLRKLVCPFLCMALLCGCTSQHLTTNKNPKQEIGKNTQSLNYKQRYYESIQYPDMDIARLDKKIKDTIQRYQKSFRKQLKDFQEERKAELNISYESYVKDQRYISVKLSIYENIYQSKEYIETIVYDSEKDTFVNLFDIYDKAQIQKLSERVVDYFKERFPEECDNDRFRSHTSPSEENFKRFVLCKDRLVIYFPQGTLFDNSATFEVGYQDLEDATDLENEDAPVFVPYQDILNEPIKNIDEKKPMVALTFDDGPTRKYTSAILDALKEHNASATFFILGNRAENAPDLLQRMVLEGSEIGNHTFSHKQLTTLSKENIEEEISATQETIYGITHRYPDVIRPPYGSKNDTVLQCAQGKRVVTWTLDTRDWAVKDAQKIVDYVMKTVKDGDIILMHDLYETSAQAAVILISQLSDEGYQLVTVSDIYSYRPNLK